MYPQRLNRRTFLAGSLALAGAAERGWSAPPAATTAPKASTIPQLGRWLADMIKFGKVHAAQFKDPNGAFDPLLGATYYDAQRIFLQIAEYSSDPAWPAAADRAMIVYRDRYVLKNHGKIPGFWIFPHGLAMHYRRTRDPKSREAVVSLAHNAAFAADSTPADWTRDAGSSREVAYVIHTLMKAEEVGEPKRPRLALLVDQALGHIDQWFVARTAKFCKPFMFGLTAEALIAYHDKTGDKRIPPALRTGADWLWKHNWLPKERAFEYIDREVSGEGGTEPAPDLNLLIAPVYAWLYRGTGDTRYRDQADAVFVGGVEQAYLTGAKQFNQNYRWSFDYVTWRRMGDRDRNRANAHPGPGRLVHPRG